MSKILSAIAARSLIYTPIIIGFFVAAACRPAARGSNLSEIDDSSSGVADLRWLDKASRALRLGKALSPDDPLRKYVNRPKSEVVDILFKDPLFFPTMIDFYSYYFGFKSNDSVSKRNSSGSLAFDPKTGTLRVVFDCEKNPGCLQYDSFKLSRNVFDHPASLNGALIVTGESSIDQLYSPEQPPYISFSSLEDVLKTLIYLKLPEASSNPTAKFDDLKQTTEKSLNALARLLQSELNQQKGDAITGLCPKFNKAILAGERVLFELYKVVDLDLVCPPAAVLSARDVQTMLDKTNGLRANVKNLFQFFEDFLTNKLTLHRGAYFEIPASLRKVWKNRLYGQSFWVTHPNSSTNYNRKRAAYVLKTFFCDDLTPVKLEIAQQPGDDRHATDPSCMACHYKLDPIAGFFRNYGSLGTNFDKSSNFIFDDSRQISGAEVEKYLSSWNFPDNKGPNQGLNVGLIRSSTDPSKNSYGSTLNDLGRLVASDSRTFMCKTKRLADYFVGGGLTYDHQWLERLANQMQSAPKTTNGGAVKTVIKNLLLSKAFTADDPVEGVCYDRAAAKASDSKLDCLVSSTLEKYCHKCHGLDSANGDLDLSQWSEKTGFSHMDEDGKPYAAKQSYQRILQRLGPSQAGPMMPLNSPMPDPDRRILINWLEKQL